MGIQGALIYTALEYIESTGTQYIDTGITGGTVGTYEIKLNTLGTSTSAYEQYFAGKKTSPAIPKLYLNQTTVGTNIAGLYTNTDSIHTVEVKSDGVYLDGTKTSTTSPGSWEVSFYLFSAHEENSLKSTMRLYYCKMWKDGVLVRDYLPCLDNNNVACLYDKVSKQFFYNQGTGDFVASSQQTPVYTGFATIKKAYVGVRQSYTPVEYLESSGTQYVDTGYKMSNNSKIVAKLSMADANIMTAVGVSGSYQSFSIQSYNDNYRIRWRSGTTSNIQVDSSIPIGTTPHIFEVNSTNAKIDGTVIGNTNSYQFAENSNLFICAMSSNNLPLNLAKGRIYYYQIYDSNTLVRDFIPVVNQDNVACLYDLIEGKFYYNQGSGTFTTGNTTGQPVILGSVAREIKTGYVGVNGVARLCFGSSKPNYTMLYAYGDNAESGGFFYTRIRKTGDNKENAFSTTNHQINATNIYVYGMQPSTSFNSYGGMITNNSFDMTEYTKIYAKTANTSTTGRGTEIYIPTFQGTTYDLGNNATSSLSFKVNSNGGLDVNKPNNVFSISKTDTRRLGLGISSNGWGSSVAAYLYVLAMFKADNITPLANILGVSADISSILAVSSQLLSNESACKCMIGTCTGDFMISALNDSTFRTNLNNSAYKNLILSNEHWNKFYTYITN